MEAERRWRLKSVCCAVEEIGFEFPGANICWLAERLSEAALRLEMLAPRVKRFWEFGSQERFAAELMSLKLKDWLTFRRDEIPVFESDVSWEAILSEGSKELLASVMFASKLSFPRFADANPFATWFLFELPAVRFPEYPSCDCCC